MNPSSMMFYKKYKLNVFNKDITKFLNLYIYVYMWALKVGRVNRMYNDY